MNLKRHLNRIHKNEREVMEANLLDNKQEKKIAWAKLINSGDHIRNISRLKENPGALITVSRRSEKSNTKSDYLPCTNCFKYILAKNMYLHNRKCKFGNVKTTTKESRLLLLQNLVSDKYNDAVKKLLLSMRGDEVTLVIRNNKLLGTYAAVMIEKKESRQQNEIIYTLRCAGRLLIAFRIASSVLSGNAELMVLPENFDKVKAAAKSEAGYHSSRSIETPSFIIKVGYILKNLSQILLNISNKEGNLQMVEKCRRYGEILDFEWEPLRNNAEVVLEQRKENIPVELPLESDIRKFKNYCCQEIERLCKKASEGLFHSSDYIQLCKVCLCRLISFNARRGGEPSRLTLEMWNGVIEDRWKRQSDIENISDIVERKLAERLKICYLHGKRKREKKVRSIVPILFTNEVVKGIKCMISMRNASGVQRDNPIHIYSQLQEEPLGILKGPFTRVRTQYRISLVRQY